MGFPSLRARLLQLVSVMACTCHLGSAEGKERGRRATGSGQTGELGTVRLFSKASSVWPGLMVALREFESLLDHSNLSRENRGLKFHLITPYFKI